MMNRTALLAAIALVMTTALSGCGVKSAPAQVDKSAYPLIYPQEPAKTPAAAYVRTGKTGKTSDTQRPRYDSSGTYNPPPPATETLVK
jgi:hypothetical protein